MGAGDTEHVGGAIPPHPTAEPAKSTDAGPGDADASAAAEVRALYEAHAGFVYQSLARLGVREADLPDLTHEVFLVAHRKLAEREGTSSARTWLFAIAFRVAAGYRRRAFRTRERLSDAPPEPGPASDRPPPPSPEDRAAAGEARAQAEAILDTLPMEERIAFVMFELDGVPCPEIARELGWPLGTVYTRVRNARRRFEDAARRLRARDRGGRP